MNEVLEKNFKETLECVRENHLSIIYVDVACTVDRFFSYKDNEAIFEKLCGVVYDVYCNKNYDENIDLIKIARKVVEYNTKFHNPTRIPRKLILEQLRGE